MNRKRHNILILVLGSLTAVGPFSIDMYLPGFPAIARDLYTDISHVALTLTSYFIGISIGQLAYGPLLDRYGRKKPLITGFVLYVVVALGCALAPTIHALIALRFLLAVGACVGIVAARAIVRDLFPVNEIARIFSTMMLVLAVSPIIAPTVGAYVTESYSWRYIFVILAAIAAIIIAAIVRYLPESRPADLSVSLHPARVVRDYFGILKEPAFVAFGIASAAASAGLFAYIADAPFVFMKLFGFTEKEFGWLFGLSACGVIGASQLNRLWLKRRSSREISLRAVIAQTLVTVALVAGVIVRMPAAGVIAGLFCFLMCIGFLSPNVTALAIEPFAKHAGTASALMGSMQMSAAALSSALVSYFHNGTAMPMAALLMTSALVSLSFQVGHKVFGGHSERSEAE